MSTTQGSKRGETVLEMLAEQARDYGTRTAFVASDRLALSYAALLAEIDRTGHALADLGIGRGARVALAIPSGPEAAVALLSTMVWTTCVPLDPTLDRRRCELLLRALRVDAVVVKIGGDGEFAAAAGALGIRVLRLTTRSEGAVGTFDLHAEGHGSAVERRAPESRDLVLLLHTSGTTAIPKVVPLTHGHTIARACSQPIDSRDRCLSVAPLFTGSAIGNSLLAPLAAGASIGYPSAVSPEAILEALHHIDATYLSASPTLLSSLLDVIERRGPCLSPTLRFVRSSSHALSPQLQERLETAFGVPVIQGFGTTESGTIAQNPLPPALRKPGSVGLSVGPEIAVLDEKGEPCASFQAGAVVVRGAGVMSGYADNPGANGLAFHGDWLRTGDLGYLDADGYLFLTGRVKEIINRGGLKVAPAEVDEALLRHPDVRDVATFAVRHPTLGEDVAAAVVFRDGTTVTAEQLREFALGQLAPSKVPSVVFPVVVLPRNALGKVNRGALIRELEDVRRRDCAPPRTAREELVAATFADVLGLEGVGRFDNFFALGGDSLSGMRVIASVNARLGLNLTADALFRWPTVAEFAAESIRATDVHPLSPPAIVPRRSRTTSTR